MGFEAIHNVNLILREEELMKSKKISMLSPKEECMRSIREVAADRRCDLTLDIESNTDRSCRNSRLRHLTTVHGVLLSNAAKYGDGFSLMTGYNVLAVRKFTMRLCTASDWED